MAPKKLDYLQSKVLSAVQEIYAEFSRPAGVRAVSSLLNHRDTDKIENILNELEERNLLLSPAPGIWRPANASSDDTAFVQKILVQQQVKLLEHALVTKSITDLKKYVTQWCDDMEMHLS